MRGRATSDELLPFVDSIDFRFVSADDGTFVRPNLVVVGALGALVTALVIGVLLTRSRVSPS